MKVLKLLEYLAVNARYQQTTLQEMFAEQDEITVDTYSQKNSQKFRVLLSGHDQFADKTTVFQI